MSISAVQPQTPVVVAPTAAQLTAFKGEGEEKKGTGLFLPLAAGLATGGVTYYLGSKPTAEAIAKLETAEAIDTFTKSIGDAAGKISDATKKGTADTAVKTVTEALEKVKTAIPNGADAIKTAKEGVQTAIKDAVENLPKIKSIKPALIWGGVALAGTYILAKIFGGKKEA